ncbi:DUF445 family protein [Geobacter sp.]|uniref:DUF445 family protein n=1 Tax=Geobacter sp. TaxID=46610 RepID=UPI0027B9B3AA|nr:DUF445 family protein [Geobacter sp.]
MTLQSILPYVTPPVVGAVIGYVTNDIAIRMLFRPLKPWRVFGIRVPLTPGVIPAGRHEFATTIGRMVGTHLVTGEDVARALGRDAFRRELRETVGEKLDGILDRELGTVGAIIPVGLDRWLHDLAATVSRDVAVGILAQVESDGFRGELAAIIATLEERVLPRQLERLLAGEDYEAFRSGVGQALAVLLQSRGVSRAVASAVEEALEEFLSSDRPLRELLPPDAAEFLAEQLAAAVPLLLDQVGALLRTPEFREGLEGKLREGFQGYLQNLKGALGFMAGLLSADKLNSLFSGVIENIMEEILRWLGEEKTRRLVTGFARQRLDGFLDRPLAATLDGVPYQRVAAVRKLIRKGVLGFVRSPRTAEMLLAVAEREGRRLLLEGNGRTLFDRLATADGAERLRASLVDGVVALVRTAETRDTLERFVAARMDEWLFQRPLGRLSARIPADARRDLEGAVCRQVEELLQKEVPPLIDAIDVATMVEEKVNSLDILKVEELLLSIMEKHFFYINLFGALLGFIMGFMNVILARLFS